VLVPLAEIAPQLIQRSRCLAAVRASVSEAAEILAV
jgi:hypothetical protein